VQTSTQRILTTRDLLASAAQSADVAAGRYKAGVGSIIDLLTAQSALADARAQEVQARSLWFLAMAELAHATGALVPKAAEIMSTTTQKQETP
jgi:outer membrane protein